MYPRDLWSNRADIGELTITMFLEGYVQIRGIKSQPEEQEELTSPPNSEKGCFKEQQVLKVRENEKI